MFKNNLLLAITLACNLKPFQPAERTQWRTLLDRVKSSMTETRELPDGYAFRIDTGKTPLVQVAEWISLERKCCPFFEFRLRIHGQDGTLWLDLTGPRGVKQFIQQDFTGMPTAERK